MDTQCDTDISERQTDFHSQPIYQDPHTDSESTPETMKIQEGESGVDVLRECPQVKKPFFISMARKLWDRIMPQKETSKLKDLGQTMCTTSLKRKFHLVLSHLNINISRLPGAGKNTLHIYQ